MLGAQRISPESRATIRTLQRRYERLIREIVVEGIHTGVFADRDARVTTFTMLRASLGIAGWYAPDGPLPPELVAEQVTDQVVGGVLKREP